MALKNAYLALRCDYNDFRIVSRESYASSHAVEVQRGLEADSPKMGSK